MRRLRPSALLAAALLAAACRGDARPAAPLIFAAASIGDAVAAAAAGATPPPRLSVAASSALARQIIQGAPAALFVSAHPRWMDAVARAGRLDAASRRPFASTRLVLVAPAGRPFAARVAAGAPPPPPVLRRLCTGDPAHVPLGRYARAALRHLGWWSRVAPRLVPALDARAALALVERGACPAGIVYEADARRSRRVAVVAGFPGGSHPAIVYEIALVAGAPAAARRLHARLLSPAARGALRRAGFLPPPAAGTRR